MTEYSDSIWGIPISIFEAIKPAQEQTFSSSLDKVELAKLPKVATLALAATLWLCQNSYWKWPLIVDFPIKNGDFQ